MNIVGVTGISKNLPPLSNKIVGEAVLWAKNYYYPHEWVSGCAHGVDTVFAEAAFIEDPGSCHRLVVPSADHNTLLIERWESLIVDNPFKCSIEYASTKYMNSARAYMDRNDQLVSHLTHLLAFPLTPEEVQRSGTWSTVRRARKKGIPIHVFPLDSNNDPFTDGYQYREVMNG